MTVINNNKPEIKFTQPVQKNVQPEVKSEKPKTEDIAKDYKEAADNKGADAAGRAMLMLNNVRKADSADNIDNDIRKILADPTLLGKSDALFNAAERAGYSYPVAATFATSELG